MSAETEYPDTSRTGTRYQLLSAGLAFLLWGGWAWYVNDSADNGLRIIASLTQGTASFIITLVIVSIVTLFYNRFTNRRDRLVWPALLTVGITAPCLVLAHWFAGTPEIAKTVTPALTVALLYGFFTTWKLDRDNHCRKES